MKIYYATNPMKIGNYEWRCIVTDFYIGGRCTIYEFRKAPRILDGRLILADCWQNGRNWPRYDFNDTYSGLPKTLKKLYDRHREEIEAHLDERIPKHVSQGQFTLRFASPDEAS